ncbi:unnamed protein product [Ilex paraguariensis]|uniref:DC1 domain-containing protein n=1 Tax=Ilex paraguariensis TaxID=185542 RepID=A0ABC8UCY8_9AQUA
MVELLDDLALCPQKKAIHVVEKVGRILAIEKLRPKARWSFYMTYLRAHGRLSQEVPPLLRVQGRLSRELRAHGRLSREVPPLLRAQVANDGDYGGVGVVSWGLWGGYVVETQKKMELKHFNLDHPLNFEDVQKNEGTDVMCYGCKKPILDHAYCYKECDYFLHKSCAELKREIEDPIHPEHRLTLEAGSSSNICDACKQNWDRFIYYCNKCDFVICMPCFLEDRMVKLAIHQHPLAVLLRPSLFTCDICSMEVYCCGPCRYFVHVKCATSEAGSSRGAEISSSNKDDELLESNPVNLPVNDEFVDLARYFVKDININEFEKKTEINNWSHEHPLLLFDVQNINEVVPTYHRRFNTQVTLNTCLSLGDPVTSICSSDVNVATWIAMDSSTSVKLVISKLISNVLFYQALSNMNLTSTPYFKLKVHIMFASHVITGPHGSYSDVILATSIWTTIVLCSQKLSSTGGIGIPLS